MTRLLGCMVLVCVAAVGTAVGEAAQGTPPDPFNGIWKLNLQKSKATTGALPSTETVTTRVANGVMTCTLESAIAGSARKATYTARYNDSTWADARDFDGFSQLKLVKITDRLHYWVMRTRDGQAAGLVMRRMAEDGKSFSAVALGLDGNIQSTRVYEKQ